MSTSVRTLSTMVLIERFLDLIRIGQRDECSQRKGKAQAPRKKEYTINGNYVQAIS